MGYTHYWTQPSHTPEEFDKVGDVVAIEPDYVPTYLQDDE